MKRYFMVLIVLALALAWGCGGGGENPAETNLRGLDGASAEGWSARFAPGDDGAAMLLSGELEPGATGLLLTPPEGYTLGGGPVSLIEADGPLILAGMQDNDICVALKSTLTEKTAVEAQIPLERAKTVSAHRWPEYPPLKTWNFAHGTAVRWYLERIGGDGNLDGYVNGLDIIPLSVYFGQKRIDGSGNEHADYNRDGWIDNRDLFVLLANFGIGIDGVQLQRYDNEDDPNPQVFVSKHFSTYGEYGQLIGTPDDGLFMLRWYAGEQVETSGSAWSRTQGTADVCALRDLIDVSAVAISENKIELTYSYPANGDMNGDGLVSGSEVYMLAANYQHTSAFRGNLPTDEYANRLDLDYDGLVWGSGSTAADMEGELYYIWKYWGETTPFKARIYNGPEGQYPYLMATLPSPEWAVVTRVAGGCDRIVKTVELLANWQEDKLYFTYTFFPSADFETGDWRVREVPLKEIVVQQPEG